jgi:hypothetical protein
VDRLDHVIRMMRFRRLTLEYVETNAAWVRDQDQAEEVLARLAEGGLSCVLVSLSPFHAEHVPLARTLALIAAAERTLSGGAFVWIPDFLNDLRDHPPEERLDLEAHLAARGDEHARRLASRYGLVPAGRTGRYLHRHGQRLAWREIAAAPSSCATRLQDTTHFHVDLAGQYVPGLCAGVALPLDAVPGAIDLDSYPVLDALVRGGPGALVELAAREGFEPHDTYSGPCDLCTHARVFLVSRNPRAGLGPVGFYDPRSVDYSA